jgi:hypothetical protein
MNQPHYNIIATLITDSKSLLETIEHGHLLSNAIADILADTHVDDKYAAIEMQLIKFNYYHTEFEEYFFSTIKFKVEQCSTIADKLYFLLLKRKMIAQVVQQPGATNSGTKPNIKEVFENWLTQEIYFYEKVAQFCPTQCETKKPKENTFTKVNCNLSVDQLAILIRAAATVHVILAPSINKIFKTLAPYFTSINTADISYDSMRSKSYAAEKKDKTVVIEKLQKMISVVEEL